MVDKFCSWCSTSGKVSRISLFLFDGSGLRDQLMESQATVEMIRQEKEGKRLTANTVHSGCGSYLATRQHYLC